MPTEAIFDIETKKLFSDIDTTNPHDLGVSIVSVYHRQLDDHFAEIEGKMYSFWEQDFAKMWPLFTNIDRLIGFNSLNFDIPALAPLSPFDLKKITNFDILDIVKQTLGFRISLDAIAKQTLGHTKTDLGTNAVLYWQQATADSLAKLKSYCQADVLLTRDVYDYGLAHGHLKYLDKWNTVRQFDVDFSYPTPPSTSSAQPSLF